MGDECQLCGRACTRDDFCSGCNAFVCTRCDTNPAVPYGRHALSAHRGADYYCEDLNEEYDGFED